jgi:PmbA protein
LTFHSHPVSNEIADGYFVTSDGYIAENSTIVKNGILKTHLLGIYGANKLEKNRAVNDGGATIVEAGDNPHSDIIKNIEKGLLLARFSGGNPSSNGDISGVAKNSYYIENGEIKYPISETMISGNIQEMFNNIGEISSDRIDFGYCIFPWISFKGVTIS